MRSRQAIAAQRARHLVPPAVNSGVKSRGAERCQLQQKTRSLYFTPESNAWLGLALLFLVARCASSSPNSSLCASRPAICLSAPSPAPVSPRHMAARQSVLRPWWLALAPGYGLLYGESMLGPRFSHGLDVGKVAAVPTPSLAHLDCCCRT
ncbi:hypothetical protein IWX46DRAFT_613589 [Phyllosticta citricarpa]|uniref:Uncharacterized protein n=1 Tax=Phyllosticta citricarpa TaxID=55181 RepID=A0ABR1LFD1_9PEZI